VAAFGQVSVFGLEPHLDWMARLAMGVP
jgi:hypothetical protein